MPRILFIAGDPSGDVHASHVVKRVRELLPDADCFGIGGPAMVHQGFRQLFPFEPFNRMGFAEVVRGLPFLLRARKSILAILKNREADAMVLVDYYGFNSKLLAAARRHSIPAIWYIPPKVWAWKQKRAELLKKNATAIATIFPFENRFFEGGKASVRFVGNPLVEDLEERKRRGPEGKGKRATVGEQKAGSEESQKSEGKSQKPNHTEVGAGSGGRGESRSLTIAVVPGSRRQEVLHMLGPMLDAVELLSTDFPGIKTIVSQVPWLPPEIFKSFANRTDVTFSGASLDDLYARADAAFVTSGTATLEAGLRGVPHVIVYRTSYLSYRIYEAFLKIPWIGLPNIVAQRSLLPECIQHDATPQRLAEEMKKFLNSPEHYRQMVRSLLDLRETLGSKRPSEEVARMVVAALGKALPDSR